MVLERAATPGADNADIRALALQVMQSLASNGSHSMVKVPPSHCPSAPRPLCLLGARLAAVGSAALPERGPGHRAPKPPPQLLERAASKGRSPMSPPLDL